MLLERNLRSGDSEIDFDLRENEGEIDDDQSPNNFENSDDEDFAFSSSDNCPEANRDVDMDNEFSNSEETSTTDNLLPLHNYSNLHTIQFCTDLIKLSRKANLCKRHMSELLALVKSALPVPNQLPTTNYQLLSILNMDDLFTRKKFCLSCEVEIPHDSTICCRCQSNDKTSIAYV